MPRSVMALRFEITLAAEGIPVGRSQGTPSSAIECCRATGPPRPRSGSNDPVHMRDAEYERVVACTHASVDIVAGHVVVACFAAVAVEQRTEPFVEPELLRENVLALRGGAIRCGDPCGVDEARRHSAGAERRNAEHDALTPRRRRGDPDRPRIVGNREPVHAERGNVGVNLLSVRPRGRPGVILTIELFPRLRT